MATQIVYASGAFGEVVASHAAYATARSTGTSAFSVYLRIGQELSGVYTCYEGFLGFDTSLVANPVSAVLSLAAYGDFSTTDFTIEARLDDWGTTLTVGDYVAGDDLAALPLLATYDTVGGWTPQGTHRAFTDVDLLANLNLAGFTRMVFSSDRHRLATTPTGNEYVEAYASPTGAGTTTDPKLVIENDTGDPATSPDRPVAIPHNIHGV